MNDANNVGKKTECNKTSGLKVQIIMGTGWNAFQLVMSSGLKYIVQLVLAYYIAPEAFGLIGMATVFTSIVDTLNDLGMGSALIQRKENCLREEHYSTAFWTTAIFSITTFLLMALLVSSMAADFYNEPQLKPIIIVLCIPILLKPLGIIHRIKLIKEINFKPIAIIESIGTMIASIAAIIMAIYGLGVWSIALQGVISSCITIPLLWKTVSWYPKRVISRKAFTEIFNFGIFVMIKNVSTTFIENVDYLMIGKMLGSYYVGIYTFAFLLTDIARKQIMSIMNKVMFPVYSKVQDQPELVVLYYLKVIKYNTMILIPFMTIMMIFAEQIVQIIYNGKWAASVLPIQLLCIAAMFHVATGTFSTVMIGIGKAKEDFVIFFSKTFIIYLPLLYILIQRDGIVGAAVAVLIYKGATFFINLGLTKYYINVLPKEIFGSILPSFVSSIIMVVVYQIAKIIFGLPTNIYEIIAYLLLIGIVYIVSLYPFTQREAKAALKWLRGKYR